MLSFLFCTLLVYVNGGLIGGDGTELVSTPHGYRPARCVHHTEENNAVLTEKPTGTEVYYPNSNTKKWYPRDEYCVENMKEVAKHLRNKRNISLAHNMQSGLQTWVDYAGWTTGEAMGNFTSTYGVPNQMPDPSDKQLLYFFIGLQNNDDPDVTIIQPVVNYCAHCGDNGFPNGWSMEPWNCCPNGQTWYGTNIPIEENVNVDAWIYARGEGEKIEIGMSYNGKPTILSVADNKRTFDWAACTLEEYDATACGMYTSSPFNCSDMKLISLSGKSLTPKWDTAGDTRCDGGVTEDDAFNLHVYGTGKPGN